MVSVLPPYPCPKKRLMEKFMLSFNLKLLRVTMKCKYNIRILCLPPLGNQAWCVLTATLSRERMIRLPYFRSLPACARAAHTHAQPPLPDDLTRRFHRPRRKRKYMALLARQCRCQLRPHRTTLRERKKYISFLTISARYVFFSRWNKVIKAVVRRVWKALPTTTGGLRGRFMSSSGRSTAVTMMMMMICVFNPASNKWNS